MALVLNGILTESREYYRTLKRELVGRLLINPKGSLHRKKVSGHEYVRFRKKIAGRVVEYHLGPPDSPEAWKIGGIIEQSKKDVTSLREAKAALKELRVSIEEIKEQNYLEVIQSIFQAFEHAGLWEDGLELIGSWCFKVYQNNCGVEYYPERTIDVDFAVTIPYSGQPVDISALLKTMGFTEEINHADGTTSFRSGELRVEFLKDRAGDGRQRNGRGDYEKTLGIAPVALPYLRILLGNRQEIKARDLGRVVVPSMPAFMLHKLLVADVRKQDHKKEKDFRQVEAVAKAILGREDLVEETGRIASGMHKKWVGKLVKSAKRLADFVPGHSGAVAAVLERAGVDKA